MIDTSKNTSDRNSAIKGCPPFADAGEWKTGTQSRSSIDVAIYRLMKCLFKQQPPLQSIPFYRVRRTFANWLICAYLPSKLSLMAFSAPPTKKINVLIYSQMIRAKMPPKLP